MLRSFVAQGDQGIDTAGPARRDEAGDAQQPNRNLRTPVRVPPANSICERFGGTLRRECLDFLAQPRPYESIGGRQFRPLHRATQNAELVPKREVLQVKCGSGFEGRRRGSGQDVKRAERQAEELTEGI